MTADSVMPRDPQIQAITAALAAPFEPREMKFKPQMVKNNRCLAMAYIDARLIRIGSTRSSASRTGRTRTSSCPTAR